MSGRAVETVLRPPGPEPALLLGWRGLVPDVRAVEHLPRLLGEVDQRIVERVDDEAARHQRLGGVAGLQGQADAGRVVAGVALLQGQHDAPQGARLVGAHGLAAALGAGAGLAASGKRGGLVVVEVAKGGVVAAGKGHWGGRGAAVGLGWTHCSWRVRAHFLGEGR
jgi:hypothetical protein